MDSESGTVVWPGALADAESGARRALERAGGIARTTALTEMIRVLTERDALEAAEELAGQVVDPGASRAVGVTRFLTARRDQLADALAGLTENSAEKHGANPTAIL